RPSACPVARGPGVGIRTEELDVFPLGPASCGTGSTIHAGCPDPIDEVPIGRRVARLHSRPALIVRREVRAGPCRIRRRERAHGVSVELNDASTIDPNQGARNTFLAPELQTRLRSARSCGGKLLA